MAAGDLTTQEAVKLYLGLTSATDDALIASLVTSASAWVKSYLNRDILEGTYSEVRDGTGTSRLMVGQYPITDVISLTVDGMAVDLTTIVYRGAMLIRTDGATFASGYGNVSVTYKAGYAAVPADIGQAVVKMAAWAYKEKDRLGHSSKTVQGEVVAFQTQDMPNDVKTLLNNWRNVVLA
jgi:uncharacterized phiE125 gp8 family phage protein